MGELKQKQHTSTKLSDSRGSVLSFKGHCVFLLESGAVNHSCEHTIMHTLLRTNCVCECNVCDREFGRAAHLHTDTRYQVREAQINSLINLRVNLKHKHNTSMTYSRLQHLWMASDCTYSHLII